MVQEKKGDCMETKQEIDSILKRHQNAGRDQLIPILQEVQERLGFLSQDAVIQIGTHLNLPTSKIYGVATFYNQFRFNAPGKFHVQICRGTACHVKGSVNVLDALKRELKIDAGQTTKDGMFSIEVVACMGVCGLAPAMSVNGEVYADVNQDKVKKIIKQYRERAAKDDRN